MKISSVLNRKLYPDLHWAIYGAVDNDPYMRRALETPPAFVDDTVSVSPRNRHIHKMAVRVALMHFRQQKMLDKLAFIKALQAKNESVIMLGDGLNDAGALQQSNTGIVISEDTNNFTPACDAIMDAKGFHRLPDYINYARSSIRLVYYAYALAFVYNVVGLSFAVQGVLSPVIAAILMPASSLTIVLFGVGSSSLLAWRRKLWKAEEPRV